jgi:poly-beta-1,6-N-acetyl-D-glucosamine synthase
MNIWEALLLFSFFIIFYGYAGYAIIAFLILKLRKRKDPYLQEKQNYKPTVSFIVAAYNEEDCIAGKITNSLEQDYPKENIEFIFITDGSDDKTPEIVSSFPSVKLLHHPERKGKSAALNRSVSFAQNDILIFSDSNAFLNKEAVKNITRHYCNPNVGGVAGEKKVLAFTSETEQSANSEGVYWKYESALKKIDSDFYSVVGAAGELFSIRKSFYEVLPDSIILDDFVLSLKVAQKGYRVVYEPEAYASEAPSFSLEDEKKRKVRIAAGGFQAMLLLKSIFKFWENPKLSFLYISHRVLRWTIGPPCFLIAFFSNLMLVIYYPTLLYKSLFALQVLFYSLAGVTFAAPALSKKLKLAKLCYYVVFMNISVLLGFFRFLKGRQPATWEKAKRSPNITH